MTSQSIHVQGKIQLTGTQKPFEYNTQTVSYGSQRNSQR